MYFSHKGFQTTPQLHLINIYFTTPTFDMITKDTAAKFETKLSAIGGTMGLFCGFSIVSGIETLVFIIKLIVQKITPRFRLR